VAALAHRPGVALVRVEGASFVNRPGARGRVLAAVGAAGVNVDAIAGSMTSLTMTIDGQDVAAVRRALAVLQEEEGTVVERLEVFRGMALLGVVGDGVAADPGLVARMLGCLQRLGKVVELISHGPGDVGLSCVVPEIVLDQVLCALHAEFFPVRPRDGRHRAAMHEESAS
jgi:aspartokinase